MTEALLKGEKTTPQNASISRIVIAHQSPDLGRDGRQGGIRVEPQAHLS